MLCANEKINYYHFYLNSKSFANTYWMLNKITCLKLKYYLHPRNPGMPVSISWHNWYISKTQVPTLKTINIWYISRPNIPWSHHFSKTFNNMNEKVVWKNEHTFKDGSKWNRCYLRGQIPPNTRNIKIPNCWERCGVNGGRNSIQLIQLFRSSRVKWRVSCNMGIRSPCSHFRTLISSCHTESVTVVTQVN